MLRIPGYPFVEPGGKLLVLSGFLQQQMGVLMGQDGTHAGGTNGRSGGAAEHRYMRGDLPTQPTGRGGNENLMCTSVQKEHH